MGGPAPGAGRGGACYYPARMRPSPWLVLAALLAAAESPAWDRTGHMVVDAVAWDHMSEAARRGAHALLASAPSDSALYLWPLSPRQSFLRAGYWADIVRDENFPARKERYDRPAWHYVNHFWRDDGTPLPDRGTLGELVARLEALEPGRDAIQLAWTLHLVGDVHQPLHSSARVTDLEPDGDRGGNDFALDHPEAWNLHAFWDRILWIARPRRHSESHGAWIDRLASEIQEKHPRSALSEDIERAGFAGWSREGARLAMERAFPPELVRGGRPGTGYEQAVLEVSERQLALAGYRLAALLNDVFR